MAPEVHRRLRNPRRRPLEEGILWVRGDSKRAVLLESGGQDRGDHARGGLDLYRRSFRARCRRLLLLPRPRRRPHQGVRPVVYPLEVELCLADHPDVRECAVMAVELEDRRMTLKAFVVMSKPVIDAATTTRMLQEHVKHRLLPYKYPRLVEFSDELPKTGTGKIDRQALLRPHDTPP
jgi:AMP-binding enzyme C-terminal domain